MSYADAVRAAEGALAIRRAAAPLLLGGEFLPARWSAVPPERSAWELFLRSDRCALPLQTALDAGHGETPGREWAAPLAGAARRELARVMVARQHLRQLASIAAATRLRVLLLKGGAAAAGAAPLDLADVDLLVANAAAAEALAGQLLAQGWTDTDLGGAGRVSHCLIKHDLPIEIHTTLVSGEPQDEGLWERSDEVPGLDPLRQLGPDDALRHVARHVALDHPNRRMRLRDLMLIAREARRATTAEVAQAFADPQTYPARICRTAIELAIRPGSTPAPIEEDRRALLMYLLTAWRPWKALPAEAGELVDAWSVRLTCTKWEREQAWAALAIGDAKPSTRPVLRHVDAVLGACHPWLVRWWRQQTRWCYCAAMELLAAPIAYRAERTATRLPLAP